jgi:hypothetical protein
MYNSTQLISQTFYILRFKGAPDEWFVSSTVSDLEDAVHLHLNKLRRRAHHDIEFQNLFNLHGEDALGYHFVESRILRRENAWSSRASIIDRLRQEFPSCYVRGLTSKALATASI